MKPLCPANKIQTYLLRWFDQHGRKNLPWQQNKTPYRVWISEIMLQQTQVATVIPYYQRFMERFPDIITLAHAPEDEVLHYWSGLGYYSRARHLHRAAQMIEHNYSGKFPNQLSELLTLPGIGPSTAGAILAIAFQQPATILDGNVKRVLTRLHAIATPINEAVNTLWTLAEHYTPKKRVADYTQAMMDLGATLCTLRHPQCHECPFTSLCKAHIQGIASLLPTKKITKTLPIRTTTIFIIQNQARILLEKRPAKGIWGGLWSFPELSGEPETLRLQHYLKETFCLTMKKWEVLPPFRHTFSHYHLDIHPIVLKTRRMKLLDPRQQIWYNPMEPEAIGLPQPVQKILRMLSCDTFIV